jgi:hypothetical protein
VIARLQSTALRTNRPPGHDYGISKLAEILALVAPARLSKSVEKGMSAPWSHLSVLNNGGVTMRADSGVIIFCQTTNAERAKTFYRDVLGLKFEGDDPFALSFSGRQHDTASSGRALRIPR